MTSGRYILNVLIAVDQLLNTFFAGDPDETISSRAGKAAARGHRWGCILCKALDWFDRGHCGVSIEVDEGRRPVA